MAVNTILDGWTSIADIEANFMFNHTDEEFLIARIGGIVMFRQYGYFGPHIDTQELENLIDSYD